MLPNELKEMLSTREEFDKARSMSDLMIDKMNEDFSMSCGGSNYPAGYDNVDNLKTFKVPVSNCCGAIMNNFCVDTMVCPECKEHCAIEYDDAN